MSDNDGDLNGLVAWVQREVGKAVAKRTAMLSERLRQMEQDRDTLRDAWMETRDERDEARQVIVNLQRVIEEQRKEIETLCKWDVVDAGRKGA